MTTSDSKSRSSRDGATSGPGASDDDTAVPSSTDPVGCYRYLVNAAPLETIERATAEMFEALSPTDAQRIRDRLDQSPELRAGELDEAPHAQLSRFGARAEKRQPGALERAVRAGVPAGVGDELCSMLVRALVSTPAASVFLSSLEAVDPGRAGQDEPDADPDFSEEFGFASGYAGGSGFENVEFERWV